MTRTGFPGRLLRERRELRGVSLKEAHKHTRVPIEYLKALEEGHLQALPAPAFALGFVQTYCEFLDLEPEYFLDRYRHARAAAAATQAPGTPARTPQAGQPANPNYNDPEQFRLQPRWLIEAKSWAAVCAVFLGLWLTYTVVVKPLFVDTTTRIQAGTDDIVITPPTHFNDDL